MATVAKAEALLRKWLPRFGFSDYTLNVTALSDKDCGIWARICPDHDYGVLNVEVLPVGTLPPEAMELIVLHELAHALISYAGRNEDDEESACNRVARLLLGEDAYNEAVAGQQQAIPEWSNLKVNSTEAKLLVPYLVESLPERERQVIEALFYERVGMVTLGHRLGLSKYEVRKLRDSALRVIAEMVELLEEVPEGEDA